MLRDLGTVDLGSSRRKEILGLWTEARDCWPVEKIGIGFAYDVRVEQIYVKAPMVYSLWRSGGMRRGGWVVGCWPEVVRGREMSETSPKVKVCIL